MKKLFTIAGAVLISAAAFSQSQRLVLFEEVTGENCAPCAVTNPNLNVLLNANPTKVVSIKYQGPHGGPQNGPYPLFAANKTDAAAGWSYYDPSAPAPHGWLDGTAFDDHPAYLTQGIINTEYAVTSPFTIQVNHWLSSDADSIYAKVVIKATQGISGTLKANIAVIERNVYFTTPPGTNGETHFEGVMKKLLPSSSGTTLPTTYNIGDSTIINVSWKLANVYDLSELAVVAFVRDNATKNVKQTGYSPPQSLSYDAKITNDFTHACSSSESPVVSLVNPGVNTLTAVEFSYTVDNGTPSTYSWTGSLASGASTSVTLPAISIPSGTTTHTLSISTNASVNSGGGIDYNASNNTIKSEFYSSTSTMTAEWFNPYNSAAIPAGWIINNPDGDKTWGKAFNSQLNGYIRIRNFEVTIGGAIDDLIAPMVDMSALSAPQYLHFDVGYCQYFGTENDKLDVLVSTDCGDNWTNVFSKAGNALETAVPSTTYWVPASASDYRGETVDFSSYVGQSNVLYKFTFTSDLGNNVLVDNIVINGLVSVNNETDIESSFSVYPNPFTNQTRIEFSLTQAEKVKTIIYNAIGESVYASDNGTMTEGKHTLEINVGNNLPSGMYTIKLMAGDNITMKKVSIVN